MPNPIVTEEADFIEALSAPSSDVLLELLRRTSANSREELNKWEVDGSEREAYLMAKDFQDKFDAQVTDLIKLCEDFFVEFNKHVE